MRAVIFACLVVVAVARPDSPPRSAYSYERSAASVEAILRDDRIYPSAAGEYSTDTETAGGIRTSASGYGSGPDGAVEKQGSVDFTFPDGQEFSLKYVADAEGYKPESDWLPVAPAFPHPIPQFVLDQIAFAASQRSAESSEGGYTYQ